MQKNNQNVLAGAAAAIREIELSPSEIDLDRFLDRAVAFVDRWLVTPFLGAGQSAADF